MSVSVRRLLPAIALLLILGWVVGYPIVMTVLESLGLPGEGTLASYSLFVERSDEWLALWRSLWISALSAALAGLVGVPLAFVFERTDFPGRRVLGFVTRLVQFVAGMSAPPWRLSGPLAILLVHVYSMYVYFYLFTRAALARLDASLLEAAEISGAGKVRIFTRVTLPILRPAVLGAALLTFMTSLGSFSAPYLFGGSFRVMTTQIVASKLNGEIGLAQVETVALALAALAGLWIMRRMDARRIAVIGGVRGVAPARRRVDRRAARVAATFAGWLLAVLLLLPHLTLLVISFVPPVTWTTELVPPILDLSNYGELVASPERLRPVVNSLWMASAATAGALALGLAAARASLRHRGRLGRALETLTVLPWAIPGTVFAIALATTFSVDQPLLGRLVLVGTPWILPLAYLVRCLPLTGRSAFAGLRQLDPSLEEAAAILGAGRWRTLRRVTLPMLRPALVAGGGLAFITALGDFVTSIVLYTYDTRPISIEILSSLRLQETGVAAVYGVLLMVASATAFLVWGGREGAA
jgi:iron(III) transport system permease protein